MSKRDAPGLILRKQGAAFVPVSAYDAERADAMPVGAEIDAKRLGKRSNPQNRLYWALLAEYVEATWLRDKWPTSTHLHDALLRELGYVHVAFDLDGRPHLERDSTAFDQMEPPDFRLYFDAAMARLSELTGVSPDSLSARKDAA